MTTLVGPLIALGSAVFFPVPEVPEPRILWAHQDTTKISRVWCVGEDGNSIQAIAAEPGVSGFVLPPGDWACGAQSDSVEDSIMVWVTIEKGLLP